MALVMGAAMAVIMLGFTCGNLKQPGAFRAFVPTASG